MGKDSFSSKLEGFSPIELNVLDYSPERGSNIAPHFDDFWIWGERIFGLSLLSGTVMTFVSPDLETEIEIEVPRRSIYLISGTSRSNWMHGIKSEHIAERRVVCTLREIA
jgi:alkylated DNA repair protein alkB family protein 4